VRGAQIGADEAEALSLEEGYALRAKVVLEKQVDERAALQRRVRAGRAPLPGPRLDAEGLFLRK
jgi:hypothetical protein